MMKKLFKVLAISTMCLGMPLLNACSFFRSNDNEAVGIKSINVDRDEDGNAVITISYTDKHKEPVTFTLPKGSDGETGNGIKRIDYDQDDYGSTTVTISFTKESMDPVSFVLAPGKSISDVKFDTDEEGNTLIIFVDSEGNELAPITVFKGDTGEKGNGIWYIDPSLDETTGSTTLKIYFTDIDPEDPDGGHTYTEVVLPSGRGISTIISRKEGTHYYLTIQYSDGTVEDVVFDAPPTWTLGKSAPDPDYGFTGDYYFDGQHSVIYHKESNGWIPIVNFTSAETKYSVTFNLNGEGATYSDPKQQTVFPDVVRGSTFYSMHLRVPYPHRDGFVFNGWTTSPSPDITYGYFNDLTPILSDMVLYAHWTEEQA